MELYVYTVKIEGNDLAALSFLPPDDVARYGLPTEAILGDVPARQPDMTVDSFTPNDKFILFLSKVISDHAPGLASVQQQAARVKNGPVYVIDYRNVNRGERPPFEDIIGWFGVRNGQIVPDSYSANPNYQLISNAGPLQLDPHLETQLRAAVRAIQLGERVEQYDTTEDEDAWWNS